MAKQVKNLKLSDTVLTTGDEGVEYTGEGAVEVNNTTHKISVNLDKAATAAGKKIPEMTLGEIFGLLGATTEPLPTSGFRVNGTDYATFADALAALRTEPTATLELFEDVAISTTETYPTGSSNSAGLTFANPSGQSRNYTLDGHGHKITFSTFAADGILVAGFAAAQAKDMLTVAFKNLDVVCSDANVFRAFQCANATVTFENVTANSKKKNIVGVNGAVVTIDGESVLTYDGGWEPIGIDNGTGTDGAMCTILDGVVTGLPSDKPFANVENGHGTESKLVITGGQFDTLPNLSEDAGAAVEISGGRFKAAVTQNLCAAGYVPHDYDDGEYRYGVIAG